MWYRSYRGHIFFRWLFLKDSFLAYVRPRDGIICDVMLMDNDFCVENGFGLTGAKHGLQIVNLNRSVYDSMRILPLNRSLIFNTCMNNSSFGNFMTTLVWIISCTKALKLGLVRNFFLHNFKVVQYVLILCFKVLYILKLCLGQILWSWKSHLFVNIKTFSI